MPNPVMYFEIGCRDTAKAKAFYEGLFDWEFKGPGMLTGEGGISGHFNALGHEPHSYTIFYVQVDDVAEALTKIEARGGKKIVGPIDIESGTFAWFSDLDGNTVGLWTPV